MTWWKGRGRLAQVMQLGLDFENEVAWRTVEFWKVKQMQLFFWNLSIQETDCMLQQLLYWLKTCSYYCSGHYYHWQDAFRNLFDDLLAKREAVDGRCMAIPWPFHHSQVRLRKWGWQQKGWTPSLSQHSQKTFGVTGFIPHDRMGFSKPYTPRSRKARRPEIDRNCVPSISPVVFIQHLWWRIKETKRFASHDRGWELASDCFMLCCRFLFISLCTLRSQLRQPQSDKFSVPSRKTLLHDVRRVMKAPPVTFRPESLHLSTVVTPLLTDAEISIYFD